MQQKGFHSTEPAFHAVNQGQHLELQDPRGGLCECQEQFGVCKVVPAGNLLGLAFKQSEGQGSSVHGLWPLLIPAQAFCPLEKAHRK